MLGDHKQDWLAAWLEKLWMTRHRRDLRRPFTFPVPDVKVADLDTVLGYFEHNACRMR
jgi:hypothetical protein